MNPRREFPFYLITGAIIGLLLGLLSSWIFFPIQYVNTDPSVLRSDYKDEYRILIAAAYSGTGDLERARSRLSLLDNDPGDALQSQSQRTTGEMASILQGLADALQSNPQPTIQAVPTETLPAAPTEDIPPTATATALPTETSTSTPQPTRTPTASASIESNGSPTFAITAAPSSTAAAKALDTPIPRPTRAPTATPGAAFALVTADVVCEPEKPAGLMQIFLRDASGAPAPGVEMIITWSGGEEHFFSGLKPELGNGYADYKMTPGVVYTLRFASGGAGVTDLYAPQCSGSDEQDYVGGLKLSFRQP